MMGGQKNPLLGMARFKVPDVAVGEGPTTTSSATTRLCFSKKTHVGRKPEDTTLKQAYDSVVDPTTGSSHAVIIRGYTGTGKTSLVVKFRDSLAGSDSIFIAGKHEGVIKRPCHAFISALEELPFSMDLKNDDLPERIIRGLGTHFAGFCRLLPHFRDLVDFEKDRSNVNEDPLEVEAESLLTRTCFKQMVRLLVRAVTAVHPLVIFLDDMQWADESTLELVHFLLDDAESKRLLVIGCYRDNEIVEGHTLSAKMRELEKLSVVTCMKIEDFPLEVLNDFVAGVLKISDRLVTESLSEVVLRMTDGNISHVVQFLKLLLEKKLLFHCVDTNRWKWHCDHILEEMSLTSNVLENVASRLRHLPDDTQAVLKIAACMGDRFDADVVSRIAEAKEAHDGVVSIGILAASFSNTSACRSFSESPFYAAAQDCLIKRAPSSNSGEASVLNVFRFSHEKVRQAALSLYADTSERERAHFDNGRLLLDLYKSSTGLIDWYLLVGVDELNKAEALHTTKQAKVELAKANLLAAKQVSDHSAFFASAEYLQKSTELLGKGLWEEEYSTALAVYCLRARMEFCIGNFCVCYALVDEILSKATSLEDKSEAFKVKLECFAVEGRHRDVLDLINNVLVDFGASFALRGDNFKVKAEIRRTKRLLKGRTDDELLSHNVSEDPQDSFIMHVLMIAQGSAWSVSSPTRDTFRVIICHMIQLSLNRGYTNHTGLAFVLWGSLLTTLGEYKDAERFGKLGLGVRERLPCLECSAKTLVTFGALIHGMFKPFHEIINYGQEGHRLGTAGGDLGYASLGSLLSTHSRFFCGHPLAMVSEDARAYHKEMTDYNQKVAVCHMLCYRQLISNLRGEAPNACKLEGECINDIQSFVRENQIPESRQVIHFTSMILHCYMGDVDQAEYHALCHAKFKDVEFPMYYSTLYPFYRGLVWFSLVKRGNKKYLRNAKAEIAQLEKWVRSGFVNCHHTLLLLKAELQSVKKNADGLAVRKAYEEAIRAATRSGFPQHAALANERVGRFYLDLDRGWSGIFLGRAMSLYVEWGAQGKVDLVTAEFPKLDASDEVSAQSSTIAWRRRYNGTPSLHLRNTDWVKSPSATVSVESREARRDSGELSLPLFSRKGIGNHNHEFTVVGLKR